MKCERAMLIFLQEVSKMKSEYQLIKSIIWLYQQLNVIVNL